MKKNGQELWLNRGLYLLIAWAPLPLASNRPLPAAILAAFAGLLLFGWTLHVARGGRIAVSPRKLKYSLALFALVCIWIGFQWLPLPTTLSDPIWRSAENTLGGELQSRISVNPGETLSGLMRLLTYGSVFWLALQFNRDTGQARASLRFVSMIGATYALYGIIVYSMGNKWILFYPKWAYKFALSSTFVNANSFATFAGLCLLCAVTLLANRIEPVFALKHSRRIKFSFLVEEMAVRSFWITACVVLISVALALSSSRGGFIATGVGIGVLFTVRLLTRKGGWLKTSMAGVMLLGFIVIAVSVSGDRLTDKSTIEKIGESAQGRFEIYGLVTDAITSSPWVGTGFGTFGDVFPAYSTADLDPFLFWDKAHNTYLENALELGLPAALALNLAILLLAIRAASGVMTRRRDRDIPAIGIAATALVGLHSLADFSLQIPAVSIFYAFILGLSVSQSWSSSEPSDT